MTLDRIHRHVGLATIGAFLATGVFMKLGFPGLQPQPEGLIRFLFRANHVYILASGLLNLAVGTYLQPAVTPRRRSLQRTGSLLLLVAPVILLLAYVIEPPRATSHRLLTSVGVLMLFVAVVLHAIGGRRSRRES